MGGNASPELIEIHKWFFRIKEPELQTAKPPVILLLHGHLGNENAMWVLTKPLSKDYLMLAPRAPLKMGEDQYSWHDIEPQWPGIDNYKELTSQLIKRADHYLEDHDYQIDQYDVMGFSQGAVMAYALSIIHPDKIRKVAALAGFLPQTWKDQLGSISLKDQSFFVAHGKNDDIIPIKKAHQAIDWLEEKGAQITFCEAEIGHKISSNCFNGLGEFFNN